MSATISPHPEAPTAEGWPALRALARVEAKRFARHPLFLLGVAIMLIPIVAVFWQQELDANPMTGTLFIAFLFGVFGFIVAHRLTTSLLRTRDLATTTPVSRQQRTLALCLACLVPATAGVVVAIFMLVTAAIWTPVGDPVTAHVAWFRDDPAIDVLATLIALGPVAALGGPLLGVAVARWAPFRGSALIGVVTLVFLTAMPSEASTPWRVLSPWPLLVDEYVNDGGGPIVRSYFVPGVEPIWVLCYLLCLCGLAVVAALLRDPGHRRAAARCGGRADRRRGRVLPARRVMSSRPPRGAERRGAAAVVLVFVGSVAQPDAGVSGLVVRISELLLAGGAAYLLDDAAVVLTTVTPVGVWRRRLPRLLSGSQCSRGPGRWSSWCCGGRTLSRRLGGDRRAGGAVPGGAGRGRGAGRARRGRARWAGGPGRRVARHRCTHRRSSCGGCDLRAMGRVGWRRSASGLGHLGVLAVLVIAVASRDPGRSGALRSATARRRSGESPSDVRSP